MGTRGVVGIADPIGVLAADGFVGRGISKYEVVAPGAAIGRDDRIGPGVGVVPEKATQPEGPALLASLSRLKLGSRVPRKDGDGRDGVDDCVRGVAGGGG